MWSNLQNKNNPTLDGKVHAFGLGGQATVSFQVVGTISAGSYTPQVSNDGATWLPVVCFDTSGVSWSLITQAGLYRADVNSFQEFRLNPSNDMAMSGSVISFASQIALTQIAAGGDLSQLAPDWTAGSYAANAIVRHNGQFYLSKQASNAEEPGTGTQWLAFATYSAIDTYLANLFNQA